MGGRGASGKGKINARGKTNFDIATKQKSKYAGRFADGTPEQLKRAEANLKQGIEREQKAIKNSPAHITKGWEEHLKDHKNTLKELKAQYAELQREKKRRNNK